MAKKEKEPKEKDVTPDMESATHELPPEDKDEE